jgi:hypothetical protein
VVLLGGHDAPECRDLTITSRDQLIFVRQPSLQGVDAGFDFVLLLHEFGNHAVVMVFGH